MKHRTPVLYSLSVLAISVALQNFCLQTEAQGNRGRSISHRPASGGQHPARATSHRSAPRPQIPRTPRGFGSAANVRPGFYQQLSAPKQRGPLRGAGSFPVPVYVYVEPPIYREAPQVDPRSIPAPAPPQPIYVVAPPAPAPAAQPAPAAAPAQPPAVPAPAPKPRSTEPGEVQFSIQPASAEIYLDDDYLGTAAELASLDTQRYPPGVHVLEVTHPDFRPQRLVFGVSSEDPTHVLIDLSVDRIGRRSRIK